MAKVTCKIVTPEKTYLETEADMVVVPGSEGEFGCLSGHIPFLSSVKEGDVKLYDNNNITQTVSIAEGVCQVENDLVTILTEKVSS